MARVILNGTPGTVYRNDTAKAQYQLIVDWNYSCGRCIQYDHAIGPWWPVPFHRGCRCRQLPIWPGKEAEPYVDFLAKIHDLDPAQQSRVIGASNLKLVEKGVVKWSDVVTPNRIRSLREVVSREKLSVEQLTKAGVQKRFAVEAHRTVNTPEHVHAENDRKAIIARLKELGVDGDELKRRFGAKLAERVSAAPAPRPAPIVTTIPAPALPGLPPAAVAKFVPTLRASDAGQPTVLMGVAAVDAAWKQEGLGYHIPPGGGEDKQKYANAMAFVKRAIAEGIPIEQSRITVDPDGTVGFVDGRHRFAALRDLGVPDIPVSVDGPMAALARRLFGKGKGKDKDKGKDKK
jgi:hypothetical protein